jgi:UMP-CMP kinase
LVLQVCVNRCLQRGAAGSGRSDDNLESLKKRFNTYMNDTMPIIHYYEERNLVKQVAASGTPEEVGNVLYLAFFHICSEMNIMLSSYVV